MKTGTISLSQIVKELCPNGHKFCLSPECWLKEEGMRQQSMATFHMRRYRLEPGDGTRHEFFIVPLESGTMARNVDAEGNELSMDIGDIITGVQAKENAFVTLGICMPSGQGVYEVRKDSLRNPSGPFVGYLMSHMPGVKNAYTIAAILLACSVLVDRPSALEDAAEAMLRAPELI